MMKLTNSIKCAVMLLLTVAAAGLSSCSKTESYSNLLREEEKAVNLFLSGQRVENEIPADSISFLTGKDAPFYKLDEDGYVYMQVISKGDPNDRVEKDDKVYFRFTRENLKSVYLGYESETEGNSNNLAGGNASFVYGNLYLPSSTQYGQGIQWPLKFFGYNCEVNLVLRSYYGFTSDQTYCMPYLINVRYFKPEY
jgi:hypothetical protein